MKKDVTRRHSSVTPTWLWRGVISTNPESLSRRTVPTHTYSVSLGNYYADDDSRLARRRGRGRGSRTNEGLPCHNLPTSVLCSNNRSCTRPLPFTQPAPSLRPEPDPHPKSEFSGLVDLPPTDCTTPPSPSRTSYSHRGEFGSEFEFLSRVRVHPNDLRLTWSV